MSFYKNIYNKPHRPTDDYVTPQKEWQRLKDFIKPNQIIWDPFYCDGTSKAYLQDTFEPKEVIHEDVDYLNNQCEPDTYDIIVTNPPFSQKDQILRWLIDLDKPFCVLFPMTMITTKKFLKLIKDKDIKFILPSGRIRFERNGEPLKSSSFYTCIWITRYLDIKDTLIII